MTTSGGEPESLAEIAVLRLARDASAPFLLTLDDGLDGVVTRT